MLFRKKETPKERTVSFKELKFAQKIDYIIDYYKYHMVAVLIIIAIIASSVYFYKINDYESLCDIVVVDGKLTDNGTRNDALTKGFTEYLGIDGTSTRVVFDFNYSLIYDPSDQDATLSQNKIYMLASTASMDGYLADEEYIMHFTGDKELFLYDLREILTSKELAKIGQDNIITYTRADGVSFPIAVRLTDTKIKKDTDIPMDNPCYGVVITAPNKDTATDFIRYAFDL